MFERAAQARSASRWIEAGTVRKHGVGLHHFIRGDERSRHIPRHARARIPKPLVLAAFFGYFLSLLTESAPPEAFVEQRAWWERPLSHGFAVPAPLAQGSLFWGADCHGQCVHWLRNDRLQGVRSVFLSCVGAGLCPARRLAGGVVQRESWRGANFFGIYR